MKKFLGSVIAASVFLLGGCASSSGTTETATNAAEELPTVTIGVMPSTDNMPFIVAREQGFDQKHGVNIQLETFRAGQDRDAAFQAGAVDGINADLVGVATSLQGGMDLQITSATYGQFNLIGNADITSLEELDGQDILLMRNQGPEFSAEAILAQAGLSDNEVQFIDVPQVPSRVELLQSKQAGAAILPEPFVTMAIAEGLNDLGSTREIGLNPFVLTFTTKFINENTEALKAMYAAYNDAVAWMQENDRSEFIHLFVEEIGFPEAMMDQIQVPDYPKATQASVEDITKAFDWAREKGFLQKEINPEDVLSDAFFE